MLTCPARFPIVCAPDAPAPVRYAAGELSRYLSRMDGGEHPVAEAAEGFALRLSCGAPDLPDGAFRLSVAREGVALAAGEPAGCVYGAYALLERAGCRFLAQDCEVVPRGPVRLPLGEAVERPAFRVRELFWREAMDGAFAVKLRLNSARSSITPEQGGKAMFYNFSHTFDALVPVARWFDTHPEYFSMIGGRRIRERTQLCLTNPDVLRLCIEGVKGWARENPDYDIFSVAMNDWYNACQCPACRAVDEAEGSGAGTMIRFVNAVADAVAQEFPRVRIHTFAYLYCRRPPRITRPRSNVIVRLCSIECCFAHPLDACGCETGPIDVQYGHAQAFSGDPAAQSSFMRDLRGWSGLCDNLFIWDYTTNYANYVQPFPNLGALAPNLRAFRAAGVRGVFEQGNFSRGRSSALGPLKIYLLGKLLWNPDEDVPALEREFADGYFGPAAAPMLRYIRLWHMDDQPCHAGIYDPPDAPYLSEAILDRAQACLDEALALASQAPWRERVEREALSIRYVRLARSAPDAPGRDAAVDAFARDARRLGIAELFERKDFDDSVRALRESGARERSAVRSISYPI